MFLFGKVRQKIQDREKLKKKDSEGLLFVR